MDAIKKKQLESIGIDVDEALDRFMGSEALILKFLLRFPADENFARLRQALEEQDAHRAFEAAHTLKGVAGNLSMKELYRQVSTVVEALRKGDLEAAAGDMPALETQYARIIAGLNQLA